MVSFCLQAKPLYNNTEEGTVRGCFSIVMKTPLNLQLECSESPVHPPHRSLSHLYVFLTPSLPARTLEPLVPSLRQHPSNGPLLAFQIPVSSWISRPTRPAGIATGLEVQSIESGIHSKSGRSPVHGHLRHHLSPNCGINSHHQAWSHEHRKRLGQLVGLLLLNHLCSCAYWLAVEGFHSQYQESTA